MFARELSFLRPSDLYAIGDRLSDCGPFAMLASSSPEASYGQYSYLLTGPTAETRGLCPPDQPHATVPPGFAHVPFAVGVLPYDGFRSLERPLWSPADERPRGAFEEAVWTSYEASVVVDHRRGRVSVVGASRASVADVVRALSAPRRALPNIVLDATDSEAVSAHRARILRAKELIRRGDLYQVNLARKIDLSLGGDAVSSPRARVALFAALAARAPTPFGACVVRSDGATFVSTSPELALDLEPRSDGRLRATTVPIKGTRARGIDAEDDRSAALGLDADEKERAELAMIIDVERNDLHAVCVPGTVRLVRGPEVVRHKTIFHRQATLVGVSRADVSLDEVLLAMLPSGSVTGAPKVRAMEVIRALEPVRRGLYTGAFGYRTLGGGVRLAMAIRTAVFEGEGNAGHYLVGGGIVDGSDPDREAEETRWKARQLSLHGR